ncbi:DUF2793 domain-containing protein [Sphingopyxis sp. MWB1]|uniref:DUF2793 domain-containing protein n=1 Tax=Sphingopyxis sp. MWB1 TaxID=1537715 RepID=UPI00051A4976|nr:DUF2793 domain-containing protein [Sphingopyxis sp. MWB1]
MSEILTTARFALPLLAVAQAQKEITHNEALTRMDALLHAAVEEGPIDTPPAAPQEGQCWLVGAMPDGAWSGEAHVLALWSAGGWRFLRPREGMRLIRLSDRGLLRFEGGLWSPPEPIAAPSGGAVIDSEARTAISALIGLLAAHGILIPE